MAKKNSFRSAPRIVSGRDSDRCTLLIRLACAMFSFLSWSVFSGGGKEPGQKVHRGDGHTNAEQHSGENPLRSALAKGESQTRYHDRHERQSPRDGARESRLENVNRVLPWGIALRESRAGQHEGQADRDQEMALPRGNQKPAKKSF